MLRQAVLQKAGGTDDEGALTKILDHMDKLFSDLGRKHPLQQMLPQVFCNAEVALFCPLPNAQFPVAIRNNKETVIWPKFCIDFLDNLR